ncbi:hypothetical protein J6A31_04800 [bacterium]|nr:hypothetical protein [bacterium]
MGIVTGAAKGAGKVVKGIGSIFAEAVDSAGDKLRIIHAENKTYNALCESKGVVGLAKKAFNSITNYATLGIAGDIRYGIGLKSFKKMDDMSKSETMQFIGEKAEQKAIKAEQKTHDRLKLAEENLGKWDAKVDKKYTDKMAEMK